MTDFAAMLLPDRQQPARTIHLVDATGFDDFLTSQPERARTAAYAQRLQPTGYASAVLPGERPDEWAVVSVVADTAHRSPWCLARLAETLPAGNYRLAAGSAGVAALGWLLAQHRFERYRQADPLVAARVLLVSDPAMIEGTIAEAEAVVLVRDLIDTPAADMGPAALEAIATALAERCGGTTTITRGAALDAGYPLIAAVGRAAGRGYEPRLIEVEWGNPAHPRVAIVGKGVCFDSGGLDIKPSAGMRLMKKDMGGAAHALALAQLIMTARLPIRLHLLIPAVENSIAGNAFRPGDVLASRAGPTVEIGNTDAEGRLVLADALAKAVEAGPELIVDLATLTGAARVALGPDLPALFVNDDQLADAMLAAGIAAHDPVWRLPLHAGYEEMLKSDIADINNAPEGGFAGAVTAALFLQRFVPAGTAWLHLDTYAWRPIAKPGRPKGGEALGMRAVWNLLRLRYRQ